MKSAYELAMEKLEKKSPTTKLTDAQKRDIAEVDSVYRAKIAEKELFLNGQLEKARNEGDTQAVMDIERQLAGEIRRLREECETRKEKIRVGSSAT